MGALSFDVAAKAELDPEDVEIIEFTIGGKEDDKPYVAFRPTTTQIAMFGTVTAGTVPSGERIAGIFDFLKAIVDAADYQRIRARLSDRDDPFELYGTDDSAGLITVLSGVVTYWAGFPTEPSGSSPTTPTPTGPRSTGRAPGKGSTRSTSSRTASTT